jgi:hypothetical protein
MVAGADEAGATASAAVGGRATRETGAGETDDATAGGLEGPGAAEKAVAEAGTG